MDKEKKKKSPAAAIVIILVILVIAAGAGIFFINGMGSPVNSTSEETVKIDIPSGSGTGAIAAILEENGLIKSAEEFKIKSKLEGNDGKYKAGIYALSPSMSMEEMMNIIVEGKQNTLSFTVPEGFTLKQTAERVAETGVCTAEEFLNAAANDEFDFKYNEYMIQGSQRYEGFLYPDTYQIFENESAHSIIQKMLNRFVEIYDAAAAGSSVTAQYNVFEITTAASLIEREIQLDSERPLCASVIYNRLAKGMKLQMCSTVQYALGTPKARLLYSDLEIDSPYNTYKNSGLPAGPIGAPGKASIEAALNPAQTDYLFFVLTAAGSGEHNFAATGDDFSAYKDDYLASMAG